MWQGLLLPERYSLVTCTEQSWVRVTLEADDDTFDPCDKQDFSYDCYAKHTIVLLKLLSVFYSEKYEAMYYVYNIIFLSPLVATATATTIETNQTTPNIWVCAN